MAIQTHIIAMIAMGAGCAGIAWALFWPVDPRTGSNPISTHWDLVYVDDDGVMQFTLVRVIKMNPATRRMVGWCSSSGTERVFKLGKIVKAVDVRSGASVNISRLIQGLHCPKAGTPDADVIDAPASEGGTWWSASNLGLRP